GHNIASPFGTIHSPNLNLPRPLSVALPASLSYALAALDTTNGDIAGSIRERVLGVAAVDTMPDASDAPVMVRRLKGDRLVAAQPMEARKAAARAQEVWGRKGDRLATRSHPQPDTPTVAEALPIDPPAEVTPADAGGRITLASVDATAPAEAPPTAAKEEIAR